MSNVRTWYEESYKSLGNNAQRKYPNEELSRFIGRRFGHLSNTERSQLQILEVGCGSGGNLRMLIEENFQVSGVDISSEGITFAKNLIDSFSQSACLFVTDMCDMRKYISSRSLDVVVDIFSSNCLCHLDYCRFLKEVKRILKPGGIYFSYTPSKRSDAYINPGESSFIDNYTLDGISRSDSPFTGNSYPFRFMHTVEVEKILNEASFSLQYLETVGRTYRRGSEYFEFIVIEASA